MFDVEQSIGCLKQQRVATDRRDTKSGGQNRFPVGAGPNDLLDVDGEERAVSGMPRGLAEDFVGVPALDINGNGPDARRTRRTPTSVYARMECGVRGEARIQPVVAEQEAKRRLFELDRGRQPR